MHVRRDECDEHTHTFVGAVLFSCLFVRSTHTAGRTLHTGCPRTRVFGANSAKRTELENGTDSPQDCREKSRAIRAHLSAPPPNKSIININIIATNVRRHPLNRIHRKDNVKTLCKYGYTNVDTQKHTMFLL